MCSQLHHQINSFWTWYSAVRSLMVLIVLKDWLDMIWWKVTNNLELQAPVIPHYRIRKAPETWDWIKAKARAKDQLYLLKSWLPIKSSLILEITKIWKILIKANFPRKDAKRKSRRNSSRGTCKNKYKERYTGSGKLQRMPGSWPKETKQKTERQNLLQPCLLTWRTGQQIMVKS